MKANPQLKIGWASVDITPDEPVEICGQFHVRVSEGVMDPVTATALAMSAGDEAVVLVSCDLVAISDSLLQGDEKRVRNLFCDWRRRIHIRSATRR